MLIITVALLMFSGTAVAGDLMVKMPLDDYKAQQKQLDEMQDQIRALQKQVMGDAAPAAPAETRSSGGGVSSDKIKKLDRDISEIYDTLDEVETAALLDRINLGAEVRVRMDNYQVKDYMAYYADFTGPVPVWPVGPTMVVD